MITVLTMAFTYYLRIPFENFTEKFVNAIGIIKTLDEISKSDMEEMHNIEKYTHPDIRVNLYKLDRVINPSKGEFNVVNRKFRFIRDVPVESAVKEITLEESDVQNYLCIALRRVHEIILRNMKRYKIEQSMEDINEDIDQDNEALNV